jgi:type IV pilus assembly protein PilW
MPSLYLKQGSDAAIELVSGVETLQLEYGVDTDVDGSVDIYQTANQVGDWSRVLSIKVELVVLSEEDNLTVDTAQPYVLGGVEITPADRRLRTVFSKTITLRNRVP